MGSRRKSRFVAYELDPQVDMPLEPAPIARDWMDQSNRRFAYRCLPLVIANQAGWILRCPAGFRARWNGGPLPSDLTIRGTKRGPVASVLSHFGEGVVTITLPYLFRTPKNVNLWVKGPANWIKDGVQPLEGIVESDWNEATFTMNWKLTRLNHTVRFEKGEPVCMLVPVLRGLAESLEPVRLPLASDPALERAYDRWRDSRFAFNNGLARNDVEALEQGWQRDYMLGLDADGQPVDGHQTRLAIRPFGAPQPGTR